MLPFDLAALRDAIAAHVQAVYPAEACGLIIDQPGRPAYWACTNMARDKQDHFLLDPRDWVAAEDQGKILAIVHSHPDASANPSMADRVMCERSGLPWIIMGWPSGVMTTTMPVGWQAPLIGREFHHGLLDCYSIIQDYYARDLGIALPDFEREDAWWERGLNLYREGFRQAGFLEVGGAPRKHDVLLMRVAARVENHGAVYLGDGVMLHHLYGRLSERTVYGGMWERHCTAVLRHEELM